LARAQAQIFSRKFLFPALIEKGTKTFTMPKSKRSKVVSLTKTDRKTKEWKEDLFSKIRFAIDQYDYVPLPFMKSCADLQAWVFGVENMRNTYLKDVRKAWDDSKVMFGRTKVMAKALGTTKEDEYQVNLHKLSKVRLILVDAH
jgi:mRNA turnover protein 4